MSISCSSSSSSFPCDIDNLCIISRGKTPENSGLCRRCVCACARPLPLGLMSCKLSFHIRGFQNAFNNAWPHSVWVNPPDKHARSGSVRRAKKDRQTVSLPVPACVCVSGRVLLLERFLWHSADRDNLEWVRQRQLGHDFIVSPSSSSDFFARCRHPLFIMGVNNMLRYTSKWGSSHSSPFPHTHRDTDTEATTHEQVQRVVCGSRNCSTGIDFEMGNGTTFPIIYASLGSKQGINCTL